MSLHLPEKSLLVGPNREGVPKAENLMASFDSKGPEHLAKSESLRLDLTSILPVMAISLDLASILLDKYHKSLRPLTSSL